MLHKLDFMQTNQAAEHLTVSCGFLVSSAWKSNQCHHEEVKPVICGVYWSRRHIINLPHLKGQNNTSDCCNSNTEKSDLWKAGGRKSSEKDGVGDSKMEGETRAITSR